ncbi:three-Cys-motif partner protein TcmP [Herbidospora cretacea]|uniref:three-Cys-motif partner protein TcmP n=1 Tax=Herbidospora cretacea TaxID=28444 RepID=UPI0009DCB988|nr:three-Cys-motif partner protein TcmP [Herbidospora cretacea]
MTSFFENKKNPAILKHAILRQYVEPFAMKVGLRSPGNRVAVIDGYAGEGLYVDGSAGSPVLLLDTARKLSSKRRLECMFVEKDASCLEKLRALVEARAGSVTAEVYEGDVRDHLASLLRRNRGIPLLTFLDPFGLMVPFSDVVKIFDRPGGVGAPATEVLINFNATGLRRIAGHLSSPKPTEGSLRRMDEVCGGSWWRQVWSENWTENTRDKEKAEEAVIRGYAQKLSAAARPNCLFQTLDVRHKSSQLPVYYLVFLTRSIEGIAVFGESISLGLEKWRESLSKQAFDGTLFADIGLFEDGEVELADRWVADIKSNLRQLLSEGVSFRIADRYAEVYGASLGKARQKHLRRAWKELFEEGVTKTNSVGEKLLTKVIEPA